MPAPRYREDVTPPPSLVDIYANFPGTGDDVHREYRRRWDAWHSIECGRPECLRHLPTHPDAYENGGRR